jgi:CheY-like chemotaxis protein
LVDDYVLTTTSRGPNDALLQHESRVNDYVYSHLHQQKDSEETNYKSKMVNDDNENKEYVDQKRHGRSQYQLEQSRFLIAESEKELQSLFKIYIELLGAQSVIVDNSDKVISTLYQSRNEGKNYDAVILNTHLEGKGCLEVAKKIHDNDYSQRIILITTSLKEQLPKDKLDSAAITNEDILVMPFELSTLGNLLNQ